MLADARRRSVQARRSHIRQVLRRIPTAPIALCRVMCRAIARALSAAAVRVGVIWRAISGAVFIVAVRSGSMTRAMFRSLFTPAVRCGRFSIAVVASLRRHAPRKVLWPAVPHSRLSVLALTIVSFGSGLLVGSSIHTSDASRAGVEVAVAARP